MSIYSQSDVYNPNNFRIKAIQLKQGDLYRLLANFVVVTQWRRPRALSFCVDFQRLSFGLMFPVSFVETFLSYLS